MRPKSVVNLQILAFLLASLPLLPPALMGEDAGSDVAKALSLFKEEKTDELYEFCSSLKKDVIYKDIELCCHFATSIILYQNKHIEARKTLSGDELFELGWAIGFMDRMSFANLDHAEIYKKLSNAGAAVINRHYMNSENTSAALIYKLSISLRP